ncbi:MAG: hypothetical protein BWK76_14185 [Desulfobulbaceae bacterium A2]|nr:MAG: hypothetical protein BWK76_14185 [Desulfobulbaceae bacterium A2]
MTYEKEKGFTLVEMMISLAVGGIALGVVYMIFTTQQRSYIAQEEVVEMQQEQRMAMEIMAREIRNAGSNPQGIAATAAPGNGCGDEPVPFATPRTTGGKPRISVAGPFRIKFSMDLDAGCGCTGAGDMDLDAGSDCTGAGENVTFRFANTVDADGNGIADAGADDIGRDTGANPQPLASNVQAIGFAYAYDSNADGLLEVDGGGRTIWAVPNAAGDTWFSLDTDNNGVIDENDPPPVSFGLADDTLLDQIRAVRIWLLVRASRPDPSFLHNAMRDQAGNPVRYKVGVNVIDPTQGNAIADHFRRRLLDASVRCRNLGLL